MPIETDKSKHLPSWLRVAQRELVHHVHRYGTVDLKGHHQHRAGAAHDNPRILQYLATAGIATNSRLYNEDTPWCSAFVNWCIAQAGLSGTRNALAQSWLHWHNGESLDLDHPIVGAIVVYRRGHNLQAGHVAFVWEVKGPYDLLVIGGNQGEHHADPKHHKPGVSSGVTISQWKIKPLGLRWPKGVPR